jgi:hypothetical protein
MDDVTTYALLTTSFFFVALAIALLARYRTVSRRINASTDLGRDLWSSLEQRLKKQDERILDVMGRLEVIQARVMAGAAAQTPSTLSLLPVVAPSQPPAEENARHVTEPSPITQQPESQESQQSQAFGQPPGAEAELDKTEKLALSLLSGGALATPDILKGLISKGGPRSREHAARLMKELFEKGLVSRNNSSKPFVYQLTEEGKRLLE